jgi:UDPglucose 6-dehydrogenase
MGLWHLGSVTAACLAAKGCEVIGYDPDQDIVTGLSNGAPPLFEPGLEDLVRQGLAAGLLRFSDDLAAAAGACDVLWVAFDTPVDDDDNADVAWVERQVLQALEHLSPGAIVLVSAQLPVGTVRRLEQACRSLRPELDAGFACSPENLRLGKALDAFLNPDRIVVGVRNVRDRNRLQKLLERISPRIEWMSVESAEMTKHAINAFLALSVSFANEIACLCEATGADAKEVERGLKTESRIGAQAYLGPGGAFAGGTLARDIQFLKALGEARGVRAALIAAVKESNDSHRAWQAGKLAQYFDSLNGVRVALWGLTYKPGTDTLRRSPAIELCAWLAERGAQIVVHDPVVGKIPGPLGGRVVHAASPADCLAGTRALVICTEWPEYRQVSANAFDAMLPPAIVVDANRFLRQIAQASPRVRYLAVGMPADEVAGIPSVL